MGIAFQQLRDLIRKRVQQAWPAYTFLFRGARAAILMSRQHAGYAFAVDAQKARNPALRRELLKVEGSAASHADEDVKKRSAEAAPLPGSKAGSARNA